MKFKTVEWKNNQITLLDQRKLPLVESYVTCSTVDEVARAIKDMVVRGAPAIGVVVSMGVALGAQTIEVKDFESFKMQINRICDQLLNTRPTAVNLAWGLKQMKKFIDDHSDSSFLDLKEGLIGEAIRIRNEDEELCRLIGQNGNQLINDGDCILTHCNAGALATSGYGTALGVIYAAKESGKKISVIADETRPLLQGARLTAWELQKNKVPVKVISDNMAGHIMQKGGIDQVLVGADRIAVNGDVCNKIGTYTVAVLAHRHGIPFYVAAPISSIDWDCPDGNSIPIEERTATELTHIQGVPITPDGVEVENPAFDVTPHELVSAIITERGIVRSPYREGLKNIVSLL